MSWLLLLAGVAGGTLLVSAFEPESPLGLRSAAGAAIGMAALGLVGFPLALVLGLGGPTLLLAALVVSSPLLWLVGTQSRGRLVAGLRTACRGSSDRPQRAAQLGVLALAALAAGTLWRVFDRAAFVRDGAWFTGVDHNIGDLPFHLAIVQGFVLGDNLPPQHPELAGVSLTYPYLADLVAALMVAAGHELREALLAQSLLLCGCLLLLLYHWGLEATRDRRAAVLTPLLVLLSGGLGWWGFVREVFEGRDGGLLGLLSRLPHDYTIQHDGPLRWGNAVITLLVPQRAFLLGLPLFLIAALLLLRAVRQAEGTSCRRQLLAAGLVTGLAPLAHAHCFVVLVCTAVCLAVLFPRRSWWGFFAPVLALAGPQVAWLAVGHALRGASFLGWHLGWQRGEMNPIGFWLYNTGLFIPLLLVALFWRSRGQPFLPPGLLRFYLPFAGCFLLPNLLRLSPWIWDNIKFLFLWFVASAPLVALVLARLSRRGRLGLLSSATLLATLTLAGGLDLWRVASGAVERRVFDREGVEFARWVAEVTPTDARFVIAPTYNHPLYLAGRRALVGYDGHLWSQGLDYGERLDAVKRLYAGAPDSAGLIERHGVDFIVLGPLERQALGARAEALSGLRLRAAQGRYRLYEARGE